MDHGHRIDIVNGEITDARAERLTTSGEVEHAWQGAPSRFSSPSLRWLRE
jgi:hypothetical protein